MSGSPAASIVLCNSTAGSTDRFDNSNTPTFGGIVEWGITIIIDNFANFIVIIKVVKNFEVSASSCEVDAMSSINKNGNY